MVLMRALTFSEQPMDGNEKKDVNATVAIKVDVESVKKKQKRAVGGGVEDVYTEDHLITPWPVSVAR